MVIVSGDPWLSWQRAGELAMVPPGRNVLRLSIHSPSLHVKVWLPRGGVAVLLWFHRELFKVPDAISGYDSVTWTLFGVLPSGIMARERDLQTQRNDDYERLRYRASSLEGKLTLTMAAITLLVVGGITYLANQLTLDAVEGSLARTATEVADAIALRLESGFPELGVLHQVLLDYVHTNSEIEAVVVFSLASDGRLLKLAEAGTQIASFREQERAVETRARASRRVTVKDQHLWSLGVPIVLDEEPIGVVGVWSSLLAADLILQQNRRRALIAAPLSVALIVLTLRLVFNRFVHRPLRELEQAMSLAETGDLEAEVPVVRKDELGFIAGRYNSMLTRIRSIIEEREVLHGRVKQFNEELETKIAESTRKLEARNVELRRLNQDLYFLQRRLARIERLSAAQQVAAKFAHKIGTPLNLISGHIQVLQQTRQDDGALGKKLQLVQSQNREAHSDCAQHVGRDTKTGPGAPGFRFEPAGRPHLHARRADILEQEGSRRAELVSRTGADSRR